MQKEIKGFNGRYKLDNNGNIFNNDKQMSPYLLNSGYQAIKLQFKGKRFNYLIHRLIAEYFVENKDNNTIVDHIDGNKLNNVADNLRWCSQKENLHFHGFKSVTAFNHSASVFSKDDIIYIRQCREIKGLKNKEIYKLYPKISHSAIDQVLNYKTYKNIENTVLT